MFDGRKDNALTVARTETVGTANVARMTAYEEAGIEEHQWVTSRDAEVRESHQELEGETVKIGEPFSNGLTFPGDTSGGDVAAFANCRCDLVAVLPGKSWDAAHLDAQWKGFATRLDADEKRVKSLYLRIVEEQRRRVRDALGV